MSVYALLAIAALALVPHELVPLDTTDLVELNHVYDLEGRKALDQVIFWEWNPAEGAFRVVAWRLLKSPAQTPERDWLRGGYRVLWEDVDGPRLVRAASFQETWTQFDPELEDRQFLSPERRRGLAGRRTPSMTVPWPSGQ